jgi:zinc and cadmium transporter
MQADLWFIYLLRVMGLGLVAFGAYAARVKASVELKYVLSASGAFLFGLILLHLIPEVFSSSLPYAGVYVLIGFLIQLFLDYFSKGIEHGHIHSSRGLSSLVVFAGLCIHAFFEGFPVIDTAAASFKFNFPLLIGILAHKIPVIVVLVWLLNDSGFSKRNTLFMIGIFILMMPLGSLANISLSMLMSDTSIYRPVVLSIVTGVLLHVATTIMYENDQHHHFNLRKTLAILAGFLLAALSAI